MSDRYTQIVNSPLGAVTRRIGLPAPVELDRYVQGMPLIDGTVLLGAAPGADARLARAAARVLADAHTPTATALDEHLRTAAADAGLDASVFNPGAPADARFKGLVFDATSITGSSRLRELRAFFGPTIRRVERSGRVVVLGTPPGDAGGVREATAQRALEGFTRSVAKELRGGATAQLVYVAPGAEEALDSTLRFLLSPRSAYVSGQVVRISAPTADPPTAAFDWDRPLDGRVALVTGASRGIGEAIAGTLARDGAHVVGLDLPSLGDDLREVAARIGGSALLVDITSDAAPELIAGHLRDIHGGVDVVVHNAGVTRDRTLARMSDDEWDLLLAINLTAQERIDDALLDAGLFRSNGRIVCVSSISGIAGNAGQSNYATSKAGVIGMVGAMAPVVAEHGLTVNAVAPGFIETQMTAKMPVTIREAGRRMNSMSQGGLPVDVAETIAWFASPASGGVNGNIVRVCGQSLLGA